RPARARSPRGRTPRRSGGCARQGTDRRCGSSGILGTGSLAIPRPVSDVNLPTRARVQECDAAAGNVIHHASSVTESILVVVLVLLVLDPDPDFEDEEDDDEDEES